MIIFPDDMPRPLSLKERHKSPFESNRVSTWVSPFDPRKEATWRLFVEELRNDAKQSRSLPHYVCMIISDTSPDSERLREIVKRRYLDIDRITGPELLLLSTVPPPDEWFVRQLKWISKLSSEVQTAQRDLIDKMRTEAGRGAIERNESGFVREILEPEVRLPGLYFLWPKVSTDGSVESQGLAFEFADFATEKRLISALELMADHARRGSLKGKSSEEFARGLLGEGDLGNLVRSLRWRKAIYRTCDLARVVKEWIERLSQAVKRPAGKE
jgi:hypothetical protein